MLVYMATNIINDKKYIGITTKTLEHRKKIHERDSKTRESYFYRALRKYGFTNFELKVIDYAKTLAELNEKEKYYISLYKTFDNKEKGYNSTNGGDNDFTFSKEELKNRSERVKGELNPMYGVESPMKGKTFTIEHKTKISNALKKANRPHVKGENNPSARKVMNLDTGETFEYINEARKKYPKATKISDVCRGVRKTAGGYKWMYLD